MILNDLFFRDEDLEKVSKSDDGSAVAETAEASQTDSHVPDTTPPPTASGTDMSTQAAYGAYGSWYQVGRLVFKNRLVVNTRRIFCDMFIILFQQPQYSSYGYQNTWNYNQGYYPPS